MNELKWVIVTGSPIDGLEIIGPFDYADEALNWAGRNYADESWWLTRLFDPDDIDKQ